MEEALLLCVTYTRWLEKEDIHVEGVGGKKMRKISNETEGGREGGREREERERERERERGRERVCLSLYSIRTSRIYTKQIQYNSLRKQCHLFLFRAGVLWFLASSLHKEAAWTAQDPFWLCHHLLPLPHGHHARLRERKDIHFSPDQYIFELSLERLAII